MPDFKRRLIHGITRFAIGFVWIYHGVVPKLLALHADEVAIIRNAGVSAEWTPIVVSCIGCAEVLMGLWVWVGWPSSRWPLLVTVVFGIATTAGVAVQSPEFLAAAFNPVSLNLTLVALAAIGILTQPCPTNPHRDA